MKMSLLERIGQRVFLMDGAMGTQIQARRPPREMWQGKEGCNEWLCVTAPDIIRDIHLAYLRAGSDAVETNSFGGSRITLGEYDLSNKAREINFAAARIAREAADAFSSEEHPRYVFGSVGPGTKLPTLGQVDFDTLCDALQEQIEALLDGGADGILLETCQDLLQIKAGLVAFEKVAGKKSDHVLYISVTVEQTGTLLIGSNIAAVVATLSPYPIHVLGLNCATGPEAMRIHLDYLAEHWPGFVACMPNAGLPEITPEGPRYPLGADRFAELLGGMAREIGLNVVGGCCGTTPEHIAALKKQVANFVPPRRAVAVPEQVSSLFAPMDLTQQPPPFYVGERANATGSKKFRDALLADNYDAAFQVLLEQEESAAHALDLSCAYAGRDEVRDMCTLVERAARECRLPLMIDSTQPEVMEAALKRYGGRAILNSVNFESGEDKAERVVKLARTFGAALVGLTIDEQGMAMTAERKFAVAQRLVNFCEARGLRRGDLFIDTLTFTIGSGDENLRTAAMETLAAIKRIKQELPGVRTLLGLSNISFGLKPSARKVLNAIFLDECLKAGLDACIINVAAIAPLHEIPADALEVARALLFNDAAQGDPLERFIRFFDTMDGETSPTAVATEATPETQIHEAIVRGRAAVLPEVVPTLLEKYSAEHILNEMLIPAMKEVGRLFNDGVLQLPFVLKSAEVMKRAVDLLRPHMKKDESARGRAKMVIATVAGDVHDIGKNLVDIILTNNGFLVVNLGTKVPIEAMMAAMKEHKADVLGMSGLLVKSAAIMAENLKALEAAGMSYPVLLGGAALTPEFVRDVCQPNYSGPVVYCRDAFEGLARMREFAETGHIQPMAPAQLPTTPPKIETPEVRVKVDRNVPAPTPPFWGWRIMREIPLQNIFPYLNTIALVRGRWGYRRGNLPAKNYQRLLEDEVMPQLEKMKAEAQRSGLFTPQAAYGWFRCRAEKESLLVAPGEGRPPITLNFPRQSRSPFFSIPDFFRSDQDVVGFMVVTLGHGLESENIRLLKEAEYQRYFLLHGFAVELTDALAEYVHAQMRAELGFPDGPMSLQDYITQKYRGSRYGFGYPACPDLAMNEICCRLVHADEISVRVTENYMLVPEVTTCALVAHHPQAKYFNV